MPLAALLGAGIGVAVFAIIGGVTLLSVYGYFQLSGAIYPRVSAADVNLGSLTYGEAVAALDTEWNGGQGLTLSDGTQTWQASPAEFGLALDSEATAQRALDIGRGGGLMGGLFDLLDALFFGGVEVEPVVSIDEAQARTGLEAWADTVRVAPQNATIRIEGADVAAVPGVPGSALDVEATLATLSANPGAALIDGTLALQTSSIAPEVADASPVVEQARRWLAAPLDVAIYDPISDETLVQTATREDLAAWLAVENTSQGPQVSVDEARIAPWLENVSATLGSPRSLDAAKNAPLISAALREGKPVTLIVSHGPTTYTVQSGDTLTRIAWKTGMPIWRIMEANPSLNADVLSAGQTLTIPSKDDLLPLPVIPHKRLVVSISQQRLWAYENGQMIREFVISTGIDRSPTQPGVFQVQSHEDPAYASAWDLWMPTFLGIYEAWPGFMNGFHGLPTLSNGVTLWADILGRPASYGCIILDLDDGEWLYTWAEEGVVTEIVE